MAAYNSSYGAYFTNNYKDQLIEQLEFTDDIPELNRFNAHYLFVYGTLKSNESRKTVLTTNKRSTFCGCGMTESDEFEMLVVPKANFPVALYKTGNKERMGALKGEIWLVPTDIIITVDRIESNGTYFHRKVFDVFSGSEKVPCFTYIGDKEFWRDKVLKDNPILRQNKRKYHYFNGAMSARIALTKEILEANGEEAKTTH